MWSFKVMPPRARRAFLFGGLACAALPGVGSLAACGFALRRPPPLTLESVHLKGFEPQSPLAAELRRQIRMAPQPVLTERPEDAQLVLESLLDRREQAAVGSSPTGFVSELTLRVRFRFQAKTPTGRELIAPSEIVLSQDMSFSESQAMAKQFEAEQLYRAMQQDVVRQVMRRLAALPPL